MKFNVLYFTACLLLSFFIFSEEEVHASDIYDTLGEVISDNSSYKYYIYWNDGDYTYANLTYPTYKVIFFNAEPTVTSSSIKFTGEYKEFLSNEHYNLTSGEWHFASSGNGFISVNNDTILNTNVPEGGKPPLGEEEPENVPPEKTIIKGLDSVSQIPEEMAKILKILIPVGLIVLSAFLTIYLIKRVIYSFF